MDAYHDAFESSKFDEPFLTTYTIDGKSLIVQERLTRHEFLVQVQLAAYMLESLGIGTGDCHIHYFSGNNKYDLILRMAAVLIGSVPVTINWDADTPERASKLVEGRQHFLAVELVFVHSVDDEGGVLERACARCLSAAVRGGG